MFRVKMRTAVKINLLIPSRVNTSSLTLTPLAINTRYIITFGVSVSELVFTRLGLNDQF